MSFVSFREVNEALRSYMPQPGMLHKAYTLERMQQLMNALDNPQDSYRVVHVAGTSGKTSTAYFMAALLRQGGNKVGLTVSPHIDEINERLQIDMIPLPEPQYCQLFSEFMSILAEINIKPTYFELLMAFAFWTFAKQKVDYAVIEVGLGGLLDATNVVHRPDKVCIITDIGLDHVDILGRTVAEIASQKAGIIRPHNEVFMYEQAAEIMQVVREVCTQNQARLHEIVAQPAEDLPLNLPLFQRRNWYLAWSTYQFLATRDKLAELDEAHMAASTTTYVPARMEIITLPSGQTLVLDGAHNAQKMSVLIKSLKSRFPKSNFAVLLSLGQNKNFQLRPSLELLTSVADHMIITSFGVAQDAHRTSINPIRIAEQCHALGYDQWKTIADATTAYETLLKRPESVLLVTGSFYLLNHLRPLIAESLRP